MTHAADSQHGAETPAPEAASAAPAGPSLAERLYLPAIAAGLANTFHHMFRLTKSIVYYRTRRRRFTVQYPEERLHDPELIGENRRLRGEHILVKDEKGREKCVACLLCMAACPAECIAIVPEAAPKTPLWADRERRPKTFDIDMLRCIYCGYCEEACPVDAIRLTPKFYVVSRTREEKVYSKEKLLENNPDYQIPSRPKK